MAAVRKVEKGVIVEHREMGCKREKGTTRRHLNLYGRGRDAEKEVFSRRGLERLWLLGRETGRKPGGGKGFIARKKQKI